MVVYQNYLEILYKTIILLILLSEKIMLTRIV
jgi:hypothetical protein